MVQLLWKTVEWFPKTLKAELSYDTIDLLSTPGYKPKKNCKWAIDNYIPMLIAVLFTINKVSVC